MQKRAQFDDRIRNLIALAQDGSKHSRTLLFSHISDLFLQGRSMSSPAQERMLTEILKELLDQIELSTRQEIASTLCALQSPPSPLIDIMCEDIVEVSGPLLEKANLPDEKLIHIIRYGTEAHRIHITRRFGLSPLVRSELEKACREAQNSKIKYSLNELDKQAEDHIADIDEETTENILELLRSQNIHGQNMPPQNIQDHNRSANNTPHKRSEPFSEDAKAKQKDIKARGVNLSFVSPTISPSPSSSASPSTLAGTAPPLDSLDHAEPTREHRKSAEHQPFTIANDAAAPLPPQAGLSDDSHIQIKDTSSDMADDILHQAHGVRHDINRHREFVRTVADWFWEVDRTGKLTYISEEAFTVFGRTALDLIGADFISFCSIPENSNHSALDETKSPETFEALFEHRKSFRNKPFYISTKDTEKTLWDFSGLAIFDIHSGRFTGFRGSATIQVSEEAPFPISSVPTNNSARPYARHQEEALEDYIKAKALKAASSASSPDSGQQKTPETESPIAKACNEEYAAELLQNLSHEFRTPLNAIIGFSEMIQMETWGSVNPDYHKNVKNILSAARHLKEAVNDVLDSAKIEAGLMQIEPETFSLKSLLKDCQKNIEDMADKNNVRLAENSRNIDVILYNDRQSVELCLTKILECSIKRGREGEIITPTVMINSNAQVRIEIPILGDRIDEKDKEKMFQKLTSEPHERHYSPQNDIKHQPQISPSFGLSIAQNLAQIIGGDISVHAEQGKLTHFVLTLSNYEPKA